MAGIEWPEWDQVFVPDGSLFESFLRGTLVYFGVMILFRLILRRQRGGAVGLGDVMLLVLISECVSQALTSDFNSIPNGVTAVGALLFWNYLTDYLSYRSNWIHRLVQCEPLPVIQDGRVLKENLRKERIRDDELYTELRKQGLDDISQIKVAFVEAEGDLTVVRKEDSNGSAASGSQDPAADPSHPPDFAATLQHFLQAARRLHQAAIWHDEQAAEHRRLATEARAELSRHGVRPKALLEAEDEGEPQSEEEERPAVNGRHPARE